MKWGALSDFAATPDGHDPSTSCFVGKRSIQLSYGVIGDEGILASEDQHLPACRSRRRPQSALQPSVRERDHSVSGGRPTEVSNTTSATLLGGSANCEAGKKVPGPRVLFFPLLQRGEPLLTCEKSADWVTILPDGTLRKARSSHAPK